MKQIVMLFFGFVLFFNMSMANANEISSTNTLGQQQSSAVTTGPIKISTDIVNGQEQSNVNNPVIQFNYPPENKITKILTPPSAYSSGQFVPFAFPTKDEVSVIQTTPFYPAKNRYTKEQLEKKLKLGLDLIQESGNTEGQPNAFEPIHTLPGLLNEPPLDTIQFQSPINGFYEETMKLAVSLAALRGTYRVCILREMASNTWGATNGFDSMIAGNILGGADMAGAASAGSRNGKSQSRNYKIAVITVYCYGKGWVPPAPNLMSPPPSLANSSVLDIPLINGFPKDADLERIAALICANRRNIKEVTLIGASDDKAISLITYEAMVKIGKHLRGKCGYCQQQTIDLLQSKTTLGNSNIIEINIR